MPYGTVNADSLVSSDGGVISPNINSLRNRIINGAMVIDQRNAGASVTVTGNPYTLDRWYSAASVDGKYTVQQNAGSVTPPTGYTNYLGCTVGASANVTVGTNDYFGIRQAIEGYNVADFGFGAATASTVTLSFWVRSSVTGTYGATLKNGGNNRSYPFTYAISTANTWEQKTVTIAGDTSGIWLTTNGVGLYVTFGLGVGSTLSGTAGSWQASNLWSATGATNWISTNSATFYITGVQLEKGSVATSFDYRPYGTELALCQRYFEKTYEIGTAPATTSTTTTSLVLYAAANSLSVSLNSTWYYKVSKRDVPTVTLYNPSTGATGTFRSIDASTDIATAQQCVSSSLVSYASQASGIAANQRYAAHYTASSEL
jgi:hypothetical protein